MRTSIRRMLSVTVDVSRHLRPCRFSVIAVAITVVVFVFVPQGREVLVALVERDDWGLAVAIFASAACFWGLQSWYWARQMLTILPQHSDTGALADNIIARVPRTLGAAALGSLAVAFLMAAAAADAGRSKLVLVSVLFIFLTLAFYVLVALRRPLINRTYQAIRKWPVAHKRLGETSLLVDHPARVSVLSKWAKRSLLLSILLFGFLSILFIVSPQFVAPRIGTGPIFLIAVGSWIPVGSMLDYLRLKRRVPTFSILVGLAVVFSAWNDNHSVRTLPNRPTRMLLADRFEQWYRARTTTVSDTTPVPLVVVAAEGGGIRAAFWTAHVLASLHEQIPSFSEHVFAVSGVSGGALGGAVYSAGLADIHRNGGLQCDTGTNPQPDGDDFVTCVDRFFSRDFLSPGLAVMLYGDVVQRFLPRIPGISPHLDRAHALEESWAAAWRDVMHTDRFDSAFGSLWDGDEEAEIPLLLFTGTSVEQGSRIITSAIDLSDSTIRDRFDDVTDFHSKVALSISLTTAVHNSARFTYFSPAGTLRDSSGEEQGHIVDGGYFDNSGAFLAAELLDALETVTRDLEVRIRPIVLLIENEIEARGEEHNHWANEVLSPLRTLLKARLAHATLAKTALLGRPVDSFRFRLAGCRGKPPLGWVLSDQRRETMAHELFDPCPSTQNRNAMQALKEIFAR